jgi:hypothetical protein
MATANTKRASDAHPLDLYNTEAWATQLAINAGVFDQERNRLMWDPCDGLGDLSNMLVANGFNVRVSDKYDHANRGITLLDFLGPHDQQADCYIVMNPPFKQTAEFIDRALEVADRVYMFNRTSVLETVTRAERFVSKQWPLKYFYQYAPRVGCSKGEDREPQAKAVMYAWYVFDKSYTGEPILRWLY